MYRKPLLLVLLSILVIFAIPTAVPVYANEVENRLKAAFLYKFCAYVQWPESTFQSQREPVNIGVVGSDELFDDVYHTVSGRTVDGRAFTVRRVNVGDRIEGLHVLYVGKESAESIDAFITSENVLPILTVTDTGEFSPVGIINFVVRDQRVRFHISNQRANAVGLKINAQLLSIALRVDGDAL
jgi:hypothetical protein